jgi:XTP/dITP diphosphohydrolase
MSDNQIVSGVRLVLASHNKGKLREFRVLLAPLGFDVISAAEAGVAEPEETGTTFAENARLKALTSLSASGLPALSDDSGIEVDALGGAPGIYAARWAGPERDFSIAMARIERELQEAGAIDPKARAARMVCALCLAFPGGRTELFEGAAPGHMVWPPRGNKGFGYDPMFVPEGHALTYGEMEPDFKHTISHRAIAFAGLVKFLKDHPECFTNT